MSIGLIKISNLNNRLIPLGLACLQAYLKMNNIPVKVFNFHSDDYTIPKAYYDPFTNNNLVNLVMNNSDFPILLHLIDTFLEGRELDFNEDLFTILFKDFAIRVRETPEIIEERYKQIIQYIKKILPKIQTFSKIGISIDYLNIIESVLLSFFLKQEVPKIKIIWGGPSITQSPDVFKLMLLRGICDGIVIGEGEQPLLEFALGKEINQIKGIVSIKDKSKKEYFYERGVQLDIDSLPTPDYTDLELEFYYYIASTYRSRGCINRCKFCGEWFLMGPRFRVRSIKKVIEDIETIIDKYHPRYIIFGESLINDDLDYFANLCDAMIEKKFPIKFGTHFRANITPELAEKAALAGFDDAWIGFETFNADELCNINKGVDLDQNISAINNFSQAGINIIAMLIVGFSSIDVEIRNKESDLQIIKHYSEKRYTTKLGEEKKLMIQWRPAPAFLVPGSLLYKEYIKTNKIIPWSPMQEDYPDNKKLNLLKLELSNIPYEFKRSISNENIIKFIREIQEADKKAGYAIGGVAKHVILTIKQMRKENKKFKKLKVPGVGAQRTKHT